MCDTSLLKLDSSRQNRKKEENNNLFLIRPQLPLRKYIVLPILTLGYTPTGPFPVLETPSSLPTPARSLSHSSQRPLVKSRDYQKQREASVIQRVYRHPMNATLCSGTNPTTATTAINSISTRFSHIPSAQPDVPAVPANSLYLAPSGTSDEEPNEGRQPRGSAGVRSRW